MKPDTSVDQARRMVKMFSTGDVSGVASIVHDEYLDHQGLGGNPIHGPEGFATVVLAARTNAAHLDVEIADVIADGDRVVLRLRWSRRDSDGHHSVRETIEILRFENDLAVEHWGAHS
jgi:predicted SnoaL-like aldol condensation-catalyzing enzyme